MLKKTHNFKNNLKAKTNKVIYQTHLKMLLICLISSSPKKKNPLKARIFINLNNLRTLATLKRKYQTQMIPKK